MTLDPTSCSSKLEPCPFHASGSTVCLYLENTDRVRFRVGCSYCGTLGPLTNSKEEAVGLWNSAKR
jgi:hypothetical protein